MARSTVDFSTISRVLVVHLRHYGDVLLTSPVFSALKKHAPHIETDALVYDHTAEMLTLELGKRLEGDGSTAAGLRAVTRVDQGLGIPTAGTSLVDGSGLTHDNRTTCAALLAAIDRGTSDPRLNAIALGLPVAGLSGTLVNRWAGTPLQGHLAAKTGSIDGVVAMAGVLDLGHPIHFAMILNGPGNLTDVEQRVVAALATYPG